MQEMVHEFPSFENAPKLDGENSALIFRRDSCSEQSTKRENPTTFYSITIGKHDEDDNGIEDAISFATKSSSGSRFVKATSNWINATNRKYFAKAGSSAFVHLGQYTAELRESGSGSPIVL